MQIRRGDNQESKQQNQKDDVLARSEEDIWETLTSRMGNLGTYCLLQINGQRKFFDPLDDAPPVGDGCEIFIGRVPRDMYEDELVPLFASIGPIHELRLMMNFSGTNRGFAFVMYKQPEYAERAIAALNEYQVRPGHYIGVLQSVNNRRLYIGRLHPSIAYESVLLEQLRSVTEGLLSLRIHIMKKVHEKPHRNYALAVYKSHRHAAMARRFLILHKHNIFDHGVTVDWACPTIGIGAAMRSGGDDIDHSFYNNDNKGPFVSTPLAEPPNLHRPKNRNSPAKDTRPKSKQTLEHSKTFQQSHHDDSRKDLKLARAIQPFMNFNTSQTDDKFCEDCFSGKKNLSVGRLTAAFYSLSPVPKRNCVLPLQPYANNTIGPDYNPNRLVGVQGFNQVDKQRCSDQASLYKKNRKTAIGAYGRQSRV